jgi:putative glutamine amidotransferase
MISKPLIGLTTTRMPNPKMHPAYGVNVPYANSISSAGGLPILIPLNLPDDDLDLLLQRLDGILFTGGGDIDPTHYGNQPHSQVEGIDAERDHVEINLALTVMRIGKPFLGICRGIQVINVALGGSLYEDLVEQFPGSVQHDNHALPRNYLAHSVKVQPDSPLANILGGNQTKVNSLHHQGVRVLAPELSVIASAPDGLIEAVELLGHPFGWAVQWHPEELQELEPMRRLFKELVLACQAKHEH